MRRVKGREGWTRREGEKKVTEENERKGRREEA